MRVLLVALAVLLAASPRLDAQSLPHLALESFPDTSRRAIAPAYDDAVAHPDDAGRIGRLAMLLHAWEQFDAAAAAYARARQLDPSFNWFYLGGQVEARLAHQRDAARLLAEAVRLNPDSVAARLALADALLEAGDGDAAREYAKLTTGASAPHAHYGLGRALEARGDHEGACAHLKTAVELYPEFGAAWYSLGMVQRNMGQVDNARQSLARAQQYGARWPAVDDPLMVRVRALRDDPEAHAERGLALQKQGNVAAAIAEYEAAVAASPDLVSAHANLISLYARQQDWARAEAHYQAALHGGAPVAEAHYNFGMALAMQGRKEAAAEAYKKALAINPQYANAWSGLGQLAEMDGRLGEAESSYRKAAEQAPADPLIRFNIARMLIATQRYREAIAELQPQSRWTTPIGRAFCSGSRRRTCSPATSPRAAGTGCRRWTWPRAAGRWIWRLRIQRNLEKLPQ
jgi:superkiller protein 3